ncbi:4,5-DOPA dioxygenase extradiol [Sphingobacterium shayense]|uniref:4,5-DOPA-extradiol-dioxygenase n=1 Tax=Sphingobacterium shayense TaxID=626343 RepID=UPI0015554C77|nr:4,5-DOPA dioxygenase extradiol [Sphingobacterium shayense]NQD71105.1 4,5-DOPA dioxygenase extradiol [Sphingobacterium shayense]
MEQEKFIHHSSTLPASGVVNKVNSLNNFLRDAQHSVKMPVLFLGHGSPMNAIAENEFVEGFRNIGQEIEKPTAILVISAHWETRGTYVTAMSRPKTIHDFGGFPQELFDVQYPAPGSPELATATQQIVSLTDIHLDDKWGLDHGAWSVVRHLYPDADVPVIQMSIDYSQSPRYHYTLAKELAKLRHKGVLIIGSGNMVHNLGMVSWQHLNSTYGFDWALEANEKMKSYITNKDHEPLINFRSQGRVFDLAIPTPEHYLPLIYSLALQDDKDDIFVFNDSPVAGALTMTSVKIG